MRFVRAIGDCWICESKFEWTSPRGGSYEVPMGTFRYFFFMDFYSRQSAHAVRDVPSWNLSDTTSLAKDNQLASSILHWQPGANYHHKVAWELLVLTRVDSILEFPCTDFDFYTIYSNVRCKLVPTASSLLGFFCTGIRVNTTNHWTSLTVSKWKHKISGPGYVKVRRGNSLWTIDITFSQQDSDPGWRSKVDKSGERSLSSIHCSRSTVVRSEFKRCSWACCFLYYRSAVYLAISAD